MLCIVTMDKCSLVLKVQEEPELNTWVGDGEADPMNAGAAKGISKGRVLIAIEYAPNLIMGAASSPLGIVSLRLLCFDGMLDQLERSAPKRVNCYGHHVPIAAMPVD
jgi:hypothetical protein